MVETEAVASGARIRPQLAAAGSQIIGKSTRAFWIGLFVFSIAVPIQLNLGDLRLDLFRIYLLLGFFPFLFMVLSGKLGGRIWSDYAMIAFATWTMVILLYHHGGPRLQFAGINAVEILGGYLAARVLIRCPADYKSFVNALFISVLIILPFSTIEMLTNRSYITEWIGMFFETTPKWNLTRFDMTRAQGGFPHPILFGLYCSYAFANVYYLYRHKITNALLRCVIVTMTALTALSSSAALSLLFQGLVILWGIVTKSKWRMLTFLAIGFYVFLDIAANRSPAVLLIETLTFNSGTGWYRVHIWTYGSAEVLRHPLVGIGMKDWVRPHWMVNSSIDNFWLVVSMRYGLTGFLMLASAVAYNIFRITRAKGLSVAQHTARLGYMVTLVGVFFTLGTVHIWGPMSVLFTFYIGAGVFLFTTKPEADGDQAAPPPDPTMLRRAQQGRITAAQTPPTPTRPKGR